MFALAAVISPSLDLQQIIWTSAVRANMDDSDTQGMCMVLNLAGKGCKNFIMTNSKEVAPVARNIQCT